MIDCRRNLIEMLMPEITACEKTFHSSERHVIDSPNGVYVVVCFTQNNGSNNPDMLR